MPRATTLPAAALLILASPSFASLSFDPREAAIQTRPDMKRAEAQFAFTNTGDTAVTITRISTGCGCTAAELEKKTYAPGESGTLPVRFTPEGKPGTRTMHITVRMDDREQPRGVRERRGLHPPLAPP